MNLRWYQNEGVENIRAAYRAGHRRVLFRSPPRSGKTPLFGAIVQGAAARGNSTYILVHRDYLLEQTSDKLDQFGVPHGLVSPDYSPSHESVQIASVQTLIRRLDKMTRPKFLVIDEAHHAASATYARIIEWAACPVLGVTATPARLDGRGLDEWFDTLVDGPPTERLIREGWIAKPRVFKPDVIPDTSGVGIHHGDYDVKALARIMERPTVVGDVIEQYRKHAHCKPTVAFCADIDNSELYAAKFRAAGYSAVCISAKTPTVARRRVLDDFRAGRINVVTNCDLISEGFDFPGVMAVIQLRRTFSLTLYIQQTYRCLNAGSDGIILDHVGNFFIHGCPDEERAWSLAGRKKREGSRREQVVVPASRQCPKCMSWHRPEPTCPFCGHTYAIEAVQMRQVAGELTEVSATAKGIPQVLLTLDAQAEKDLKFLTRMGEKRGYPNPERWARHVAFGRMKKRQSESIHG